MMTKLELAPFTVTEMNYIKEYCKVSEPVAVALDMLQGEAQAYFGTLLPTIIVAKQMLEAMINARGVLQLQHCKDYAKALLPVQYLVPVPVRQVVHLVGPVLPVPSQ